MNKKLMTDYSFSERCRGIEKKLLIVTDDDEKKKLMMALNKMKKIFRKKLMI